MVMAPDSWKEMYASLRDQARAGTIPAARIDDAVRRILRIKVLAGLFASTPPDPGGDFAVVGTAAHHLLAREAVRKSLVLLKDEGKVLPIAPGRHVLVTGDGADSIGMQSGGWTVDWQGAHNSNADVAGATSIFAGLRAALAQTGGSAELSADGSFAHRPDVAIVVFGEAPYAEFEGDRETLALPHAERVLGVLRRLRAQHIPVVSVLLSGRPLWVNPELNASDAFVAAWLPGGESEGVADLLVAGKTGAPAYDFTGRLSFPWPATAMPVTYDAQDHVSGALFARGYGLDSAHPATVPTLSEQADIPAKWASVDTFYGAGHVIAPWSIYLTDTAAQVRLTRDAQDSPAKALRAAREGDAIRASWSGNGEGTFWIGDTESDFASRAKEGYGLSFTYKVDRAPAGKMLLGMQCGPGCAGWVDVTAALHAVGWQTLRVPLACFAARGAALGRVDTPFALRTRDAAAVTIRDVSLVGGAGSACPAA